MHKSPPLLFGKSPVIRNFYGFPFLCSVFPVLTHSDGCHDEAGAGEKERPERPDVGVVQVDLGGVQAVARVFRISYHSVDAALGQSSILRVDIIGSIRATLRFHLNISTLAFTMFFPRIYLHNDTPSTHLPEKSTHHWDRYLLPCTRILIFCTRSPCRTGSASSSRHSIRPGSQFLVRCTRPALHTGDK